MLTGIAHVNLTVPTDTLDEAEAFYSNTLGMQRVPVPVLQKVSLLRVSKTKPPAHHFPTTG
jgi:catechol 2,3-dioxygenase-like lactoylglutathione lyase family enzyme